MLRKRVMMGKAEPPAPPMRKIHVSADCINMPLIYCNDETLYGGTINIEEPFDKHTSMKMWYTGSSTGEYYGTFGASKIFSLDLRGLDVVGFFRNQGRCSSISGLGEIILEDGMDLSQFFYGCERMHTYDLSSWEYKDVIMTDMFNSHYGKTIHIPNLLPKVGYDHGMVFYAASASLTMQIDISGWNLEHAQGVYWSGGIPYARIKCKQEVADYIASKADYHQPPTFEIVG